MIVVGLIKESKLRLPSKVASCCNIKGFVSGVLGAGGLKLRGFVRVANIYSAVGIGDDSNWLPLGCQTVRFYGLLCEYFLRQIFSWSSRLYTTAHIKYVQYYMLYIKFCASK